MAASLPNYFKYVFIFKNWSLSRRRGQRPPIPHLEFPSNTLRFSAGRRRRRAPPRAIHIPKNWRYSLRRKRKFAKPGRARGYLAVLASPGRPPSTPRHISSKTEISRSPPSTPYVFRHGLFFFSLLQIKNPPRLIAAFQKKQSCLLKSKPPPAPHTICSAGSGSHANVEGGGRGGSLGRGSTPPTGPPDYHRSNIRRPPGP